MQERERESEDWILMVGPEKASSSWGSRGPWRTIDCATAAPPNAIAASLLGTRWCAAGCRRVAAREPKDTLRSQTSTLRGGHSRAQNHGISLPAA